MILEEMYDRYNLLLFIKEELSNKGHSFKELGTLNSQLDLLDELINKESFSVLNELLRKTNYRLLKRIEKGHKNLIDIFKNPDLWQLGLLENNQNEWINNQALVFQTQRQSLMFSKTINGHKYVNNKWQ